jgi:hypothetical protein
MCTNVFISISTIDHNNNCRISWPEFQKKLQLWSHTHGQAEGKQQRTDDFVILSYELLSFSCAWFLLACLNISQIVTTSKSFRSKERVVECTMQSHFNVIFQYNLNIGKDGIWKHVIKRKYKELTNAFVHTILSPLQSPRTTEGVNNENL